MSELKVTIEEVNDVQTHPNADRLDIITVRGWNCVVGRDSLEKGDLVVYFPIDSILPTELEEIIFSDSKIKLDKSRVRTIKIRGAISQGLAVPFEKLALYPKLMIIKNWGDDIKDILGVTKFEPKEESPFTVRGGKIASKKQINPNFNKYTDLNHLKNYQNVFDDNDIVVITEKIHGTNFRAGYVPKVKGSFYKELKRKIMMFLKGEKDEYPGYEFVYGSHNVQLQEKNSFNKGIQNNFERKKNVYEEMVERYDLKNKLCAGMVIYGEIYGDGIQKNYTYGLKDKIDMVVFDVMLHGQYKSLGIAMLICNGIGLPFVPILGYETYKDLNLDNYIYGNSVLCPTQKIREGVVIRPIAEETGYMGRKVFKVISPDYLLQKGNSDWH